MANAKKTRNLAAVSRFAELGCRSIEFHFAVAKDKFSLADFDAAMKRGNRGRRAALCSTLSSGETDYHIHFAWNEADEKEVELWGSYCEGALAPKPDEKEPYAEQFMAWLGKFFGSENANADLQAVFRYPVTVRQSRYLLPVRVAIVPGLDTAINGISIDLPSRPRGIDIVRLVTGTKHLTITLMGTAKVKFDQFDIYEHLSHLSELALALTDSRKPS